MRRVVGRYALVEESHYDLGDRHDRVALLGIASNLGDARGRGDIA